MSLGGHALIRVIPWVAVIMGVAWSLPWTMTSERRHLYTIFRPIGDLLDMVVDHQRFFCVRIAYGISALSCALPVLSRCSGKCRSP